MKKRVEESVYQVVVATVGDYERMRRLLKSDTLSRTQIDELGRKVNAIDNALIAVCSGECEGVREALLSDIAEKRGFEKCRSKEYYGTAKTFFKRKRDAICLIAEMMGLV